MKPLGSQLPSILKKQSNWLLDLNANLQSILPGELRGHIQVAALRRDILTLVADSPVWATKIRYLSNEIASKMSVTSGLTIKSIQTVIRPIQAKPISAQRNAIQISRHSAKQIKALAKTTAHPALKQALSNLAKRAKR